MSVPVLKLIMAQSVSLHQGPMVTGTANNGTVNSPTEIINMPEQDPWIIPWETKENVLKNNKEKKKHPIFQC